jgi:hypothetical protein
VPRVESNQILLNPSTITRALGAVAFFLVLASIGGQLSKFLLGHGYVKGLVPLFDLDSERNVPTFFSVLLLIFAALLLAFIAVLNGRRESSDVSKWTILSFGFLYMAYDEAFNVHELLIVPVRTLLGNSNLGIFYYAWVIPGIALAFVLALFFLKFLLRLPATTMLTVLLAATLYIGGCIGFELIGGSYAESHGSKNLTYNMITTIEEGLEMAGLIVFIYALLVYIADTYKEVRFRFK